MNKQEARAQQRQDKVRVLSSLSQARLEASGSRFLPSFRGTGPAPATMSDMSIKARTQASLMSSGVRLGHCQAASSDSSGSWHESGHTSSTQGADAPFDKEPRIHCMTADMVCLSMVRGLVQGNPLKLCVHCAALVPGKVSASDCLGSDLLLHLCNLVTKHVERTSTGTSVVPVLAS